MLGVAAFSLIKKSQAAAHRKKLLLLLSFEPIQIQTCLRKRKKAITTSKLLTYANNWRPSFEVLLLLYLTQHGEFFSLHRLFLLDCLAGTVKIAKKFFYVVQGDNT